MSTFNDQRRRRDLAAIHTGKKQLHLDDDAYRSMLNSITGKTSAAELSATERGDVLDWMRDQGFHVQPGRTRKPRPTQEQKIRALWAELAVLGVLHESSEGALASFVERQTKKTRMEWCTPVELNAVIEALKSWLRREKRKREHGA